MKDIKYVLLGLALISQALMTSCGEDSTESVILGTWLGTSIVRSGCSDPLDNGDLECKRDLSQCVSCMTLVLGRDGTYSLTANFDGSPNSETGDFEAKSGKIRLDPSDGDPYDLPVSDVSESDMIIDLPLSNGCSAKISLESTNC